jgi:alpha-ribazole phosphatase
MEIFLIRHTTTEVARGICYGQADLDITTSFYQEATVIQQCLPPGIKTIYSSPLQRCTKLAAHLFKAHTIQLQEDLKEIDCGEWELQLWDNIPKDEIEPWMNDLINVCIPGGESYLQVFERVVKCFNQIIEHHSSHMEETQAKPTDNSIPALAIIAHGGVIRSILSYITQTPLQDSFRAFSLHYGCVIKIIHEAGSLRHEVLSNIATGKETHKPSW